MLQVTSLAFFESGNLLASGDHEGTICVWDIAAAKVNATLKGHVGPVWSLSASYGPGPAAVLASGEQPSPICPDRHASCC